MRVFVSIAFLVLLTCLESERTPEFFLEQSNPYRHFFFFSRPDHEASLIEKRRPLEALISLIDGAKTELLLFCYSLDQEEIVEALARAHHRGVKLRIIGDPEENYPLLQGKAFLIERRERSGLQHVKLALADHRHLFTGTGNFTRSGFFHNNNAFWKFQLTEDEGARLQDMLLEKENSILRLGDARVLVSPGNGKLIQLVILQAILEARHSIQFSIYSFTDPLIMAALLRRAMEGLYIEGIVDDPSHQGKLPQNSQATVLNRLAAAHPVFLYADGNSNVFSRGDLLAGGHMHHKTMIIDSRRVLSGSYNWSLAARDSNLEIFFDFDNPWIADLFAQDFARSRKVAFLAGRSAWPGEAPDLRACEAGVQVLFQGPAPYLSVRETRQEAEDCEAETRRIGPAFTDADEGIRLTYSSDGGAQLEGNPYKASLPDPLFSEPISAERARLDLGWIWLKEPLAVREAIVWQEGRHLRYTLAGERSDFLPLPQTIQGDAIYLLRTQGVDYLGCSRRGTTLEPQIALFLQLTEYYSGKQINCSSE